MGKKSPSLLGLIKAIVALVNFFPKRTSSHESYKTKSSVTGLEKQKIEVGDKIFIGNDKEFIIGYSEAGGAVSKIKITGISSASCRTINARVLPENIERIFDLKNISMIINPVTGDILDRDPWSFFCFDNKDNLNSLINSMIPVIKGLKIFTIQLGRYRQRERGYIVKFIKDKIDIQNISDKTVDEWFKQLWCGPRVKPIDIYGFKKGDSLACEPFIKDIPDELMEKCREVAMKIAVGSGRKQIPVAIREWVMDSFRTQEENACYQEPDRVYKINKGMR
jgi:hypothetical protein